MGHFADELARHNAGRRRNKTEWTSSRRNDPGTTSNVSQALSASAEGSVSLPGVSSPPVAVPDVILKPAAVQETAPQFEASLLSPGNEFEWIAWDSQLVYSPDIASYMPYQYSGPHGEVLSGIARGAPRSSRNGGLGARVRDDDNMFLQGSSYDFLSSNGLCREPSLLSQPPADLCATMAIPFDPIDGTSSARSAILQSGDHHAPGQYDDVQALGSSHASQYSFLSGEIHDTPLQHQLLRSQPLLADTDQLTTIVNDPHASSSQPPVLQELDAYPTPDADSAEFDAWLAIYLDAAVLPAERDSDYP